ncbi:hypothetical protein EB796_007228 [Bugula neritina]|uniref:Uncharacterized protein n=1 Tax=Bugula neritina TaxID=10212 RepID=A0A7J7K883_BUGNE|nr:hypothetical protein EB796_007228 [Bugula neritina]
MSTMLGVVSKFDTRSANWTKVLVAGLDYIPSSTPRKVADGPLLRARFGKLPTGMVWLIQDQVLLVCDYKKP